MPQTETLEVQLHVREVALGPITILIVRAQPWWSWWGSSRVGLAIQRLVFRIRREIGAARWP